MMKLQPQGHRRPAIAPEGSAATRGFFFGAAAQSIQGAVALGGAATQRDVRLGIILFNPIPLVKDSPWYSVCAKTSITWEAAFIMCQALAGPNCPREGYIIYGRAAAVAHHAGIDPATLIGASSYQCPPAPINGTGVLEVDVNFRKNCSWTSPPNVPGCGHADDLFLDCDGPPPPSQWSFKLIPFKPSKPQRGTLLAQPFPGARWGAVCRRGFTYREALVACQMLGFTNTRVLPPETTWASPVPVLPPNTFANLQASKDIGAGIYVSDTFCSGGQPSLRNCDFRYSSGNTSRTSCIDSFDPVGLECTTGTPPPKLAWGYMFEPHNPKTSRYIGRVRIRPNNTAPWGDICAFTYNDFSVNLVQCRFGGFGLTNPAAWGSGGLSSPPGPAYMSQLYCVPNTFTYLHDCFSIFNADGEGCITGLANYVNCIPFWKYKLLGNESTTSYRGLFQVQPQNFGGRPWGHACNSIQAEANNAAKSICKTMGFYNNPVNAIAIQIPPVDNALPVWFGNISCPFASYQIPEHGCYHELRPSDPTSYWKDTLGCASIFWIDCDPTDQGQWTYFWWESGNIANVRGHLGVKTSAKSNAWGTVSAIGVQNAHNAALAACRSLGFPEHLLSSYATMYPVASKLRSDQIPILISHIDCRTTPDAGSVNNCTSFRTSHPDVSRSAYSGQGHEGDAWVDCYPKWDYQLISQYDPEDTFDGLVIGGAMRTRPGGIVVEATEEGGGWPWGGVCPAAGGFLSPVAYVACNSVGLGGMNPINGIWSLPNFPVNLSVGERWETQCDFVVTQIAYDDAAGNNRAELDELQATMASTAAANTTTGNGTSTGAAPMSAAIGALALCRDDFVEAVLLMSVNGSHVILNATSGQLGPPNNTASDPLLNWHQRLAAAAANGMPPTTIETTSNYSMRRSVTSTTTELMDMAALLVRAANLSSSSGNGSASATNTTAGPSTSFFAVILNGMFRTNASATVSMVPPCSDAAFTGGPLAFRSWAADAALLCGSTGSKTTVFSVDDNVDTRSAPTAPPRPNASNPSSSPRYYLRRQFLSTCIDTWENETIVEARRATLTPLTHLAALRYDNVTNEVVVAALEQTRTHWLRQTRTTNISTRRTRTTAMAMWVEVTSNGTTTNGASDALSSMMFRDEDVLSVTVMDTDVDVIEEWNATTTTTDHWVAVSPLPTTASFPQKSSSPSASSSLYGSVSRMRVVNMSLASFTSLLSAVAAEAENVRRGGVVWLEDDVPPLGGTSLFDFPTVSLADGRDEDGSSSSVTIGNFQVSISSTSMPTTLTGTAQNAVTQSQGSFWGAQPPRGLPGFNVSLPHEPGWSTIDDFLAATDGSVAAAGSLPSLRWFDPLLNQAVAGNGRIDTTLFLFYNYSAKDDGLLTPAQDQAAIDLGLNQSSKIVVVASAENITAFESATRTTQRLATVTTNRTVSSDVNMSGIIAGGGGTAATLLAVSHGVVATVCVARDNVTSSLATIVPPRNSSFAWFLKRNVIPIPNYRRDPVNCTSVYMGMDLRKPTKRENMTLGYMSNLDGCDGSESVLDGCTKGLVIDIVNGRCTGKDMARVSCYPTNQWETMMQSPILFGLHIPMNPVADFDKVNYVSYVYSRISKLYPWYANCPIYASVVINETTGVETVLSETVDFSPSVRSFRQETALELCQRSSFPDAFEASWIRARDFSLAPSPRTRVAASNCTREKGAAQPRWCHFHNPPQATVVGNYSCDGKDVVRCYPSEQQWDFDLKMHPFAVMTRPISVKTSPNWRPLCADATTRVLLNQYMICNYWRYPTKRRPFRVRFANETDINPAFSPWFNGDPVKAPWFGGPFPFATVSLKFHTHPTIRRADYFPRVFIFNTVSLCPSGKVIQINCYMPTVSPSLSLTPSLSDTVSFSLSDSASPSRGSMTISDTITKSGGTPTLTRTMGSGTSSYSFPPTRSNTFSFPTKSQTHSKGTSSLSRSAGSHSWTASASFSVTGSASIPRSVTPRISLSVSNSMASPTASTTISSTESIAEIGLLLDRYEVKQYDINRADYPWNLRSINVYLLGDYLDLWTSGGIAPIAHNTSFDELNATFFPALISATTRKGPVITTTESPQRGNNSSLNSSTGDSENEAGGVFWRRSSNREISNWLYERIDIIPNRTYKFGFSTHKETMWVPSSIRVVSKTFFQIVFPPNKKYFTPRDEGVVLVVRGNAIRVKRDYDVKAAVVISTPDRLPFDPALASLAKAAMGLTMFAGGGGGAAGAARFGAIIAMQDCRMDLEEPLEFLQYPIGVPVTEEDVKFYVGAAVFNPALLAGIGALHFLVGAALSFRKWHGGVSGMGFVGFPSLSFMVVMFLLQDSVMEATVVVYRGAGTMTRLMGGFMLGLWLLMMVLTGTVLKRFFAAQYRYGRGNNGREEWDMRVARAKETPGQRLKRRVKHYFYGADEWDDGENDVGFVRRFNSLFSAYRVTREWFISVEMSTSIALGIIAGLIPDDGDCTGIVAATLVVLLLNSLALIILRPFITTYDASFALTTSVMTSGSAVFVFLGRFDQTVHLGTVGVIIVLVLMFVSSVKSILDILLTLYDFVFLSQPDEDAAEAIKGDKSGQRGGGMSSGALLSVDALANAGVVDLSFPDASVDNAHLTAITVAADGEPATVQRQPKVPNRPPLPPPKKSNPLQFTSSTSSVAAGGVTTAAAPPLPTAALPVVRKRLDETPSDMSSVSDDDDAAIGDDDDGAAGGADLLGNVLFTTRRLKSTSNKSTRRGSATAPLPLREAEGTRVDSAFATERVVQSTTLSTTLHSLLTDPQSSLPADAASWLAADPLAAGEDVPPGLGGTGGEQQDTPLAILTLSSLHTGPRKKYSRQKGRK